MLCSEAPTPADKADQRQGYREILVSIVHYVSGFDQDTIRRKNVWQQCRITSR